MTFQHQLKSHFIGKVSVCLMDGVFQASSPLRHSAELHRLLQSLPINPILCLYTDGGPDHQITYISVQISLICLFCALNSDMLITARTAPQNSFRNPVE